jgi:DNA invertase Pin-like site-specific DNA recombinase
MRAAIYARVSSDPKNLGRSVAEQEAEARLVCEREGWEVVQVFTDNDRSASRYATKRRPAFAELQAFVSNRHCDVLVCWEASRFTRDLEAYVKLRELCRANSVLWSYSGRTFDLSRTDDRLMTGLDALLAERESDQTRERVMRAMRANAAKGRPHGKLLFGYRREYDPKTGALIAQVPDETQAPLIQEAARRFLAGESAYAIAQDFKARGISGPRGGTWDMNQIRRCLTNPGYNGKRVHQGKVIGEAFWPAIIDDATFNQCVARFSDPSRLTHTGSSLKYLLTGMISCGVCGGAIRVQNNRTYKAYMCGKGFCTARKIEPVDDLITQLVIGRLQQPDVLQALASDDEPLHEALDELAAKRATLETWYEAAASGEVTPAALGRIESRLLREIAEVERRAQRPAFPAMMNDLTRDPERVWQTLSLAQKREVIRLLLSIELLPARRGVRKLDPETIRVTWRSSLVGAGPTGHMRAAALR